MFADNLTVTIGSESKTLVRVNQDNYSSEYILKENGGEWRLRLRNTKYQDKVRKVNVDRHNIELVQMVYPSVPNGIPTIRKTYTVFEIDHGDSIADTTQVVLGAAGLITSTNVGKLMNWES